MTLSQLLKNHPDGLRFTDIVSNLKSNPKSTLRQLQTGNFNFDGEVWKYKHHQSVVSQLKAKFDKPITQNPPALPIKNKVEADVKNTKPLSKFLQVTTKPKHKEKETSKMTDLNQEMNQESNNAENSTRQRLPGTPVNIVGFSMENDKASITFDYRLNSSKIYLTKSEIKHLIDVLNFLHDFKQNKES